MVKKLSVQPQHTLFNRAYTRSKYLEQELCLIDWKSGSKTHIGITNRRRFISKYKHLFNPSDFLYFRKRTVNEGLKKIFQQSIDLYVEDVIRKLVT